jgi:hypothetical protein
MRNKSILLKIDAPATPRVADDVTGFAWFRGRAFYAVRIRLLAVKI